MRATGALYELDSARMRVTREYYVLDYAKTNAYVVPQRAFRCVEATFRTRRGGRVQEARMSRPARLFRWSMT